jgi:dephospho-CoA kinase
MVIGLTGGIGTGKSTAAQILEGFGAQVISADEIGHSVYAPRSPGWAVVVREFGREIVAADGTIDRKLLGRLVFADPVCLRRLNQILHPLMGEEIGKRIDAARVTDQHAPIIVEAAVMIEANWQRMVDELWLLVASRDVVLRRVAAQRGLGAGAIESRIQAQMNDEKRCRYADIVIDNSGTPAELKEILNRLWEKRFLRKQA